MSTIQALRQRNKIRFKEHFFNIINDNDFQKEWSKQFKGYTLDILQRKHKLEAINIISYSYSASSKSILSRVFEQSTKQAFELNEPIVDHLIKTGTAYVTLDPNGYVCSVFYYLDAVEKRFIKHVSINELDVQLYEILNKIKTSHNYPKDNEIKYGEYVNSIISATRPDLYGKGFHRILSFIFGAMLCVMGYKKGFFVAIHPATTHMANGQGINFALNIKYKLGDVMFNNGTTVNDVLDKLQKRYEWKDIDKIRDMMLVLIVADYEKVRNYYKVSDKEVGKLFWKTRYENYMKLKKSRTNSKL
eukprot:489482_1